MTKVRVQDATRELSANAGKMLEDVSRLRRQSQDVLSALRRISDDFVREERERQEREAKEALHKQYEAAAQFMTAYSSQQAPEVPAEAPAAEVAPKQAPVEEAPAQAEAPAAPKPVEAPAAEAAPKEAPVKEAPVMEAPAKEAPAKEAPARETPAPKPAAPKFVPGIRVVQTKAEVEASEEARRRQLAQQRQQRQAQPQPHAGAYGRPANPQGPYGRPVNPQGPYGRPANPQGPYGRPVNPQGPYGRPANPQGPYGRPANPQGGYSRPAAPGQRSTPGGARPSQGAPRFGGGRTGGFGRKMPDLAPSVEKERVSNYDPNKKQYVRQNDPERATRNRRRDVNISGGLDDEIVRGKRKKKQQAAAPRPEPVKIEKAFMTAETITVRDLSERIGKPAGEIIKKLMMLGIIATINNELDFDTAQLVCSEFGVELEMKLAETAEDALKNEDVADAEEDLLPRPPVVTIMGHVDHGKTSLLDYIRNTRVTAGEAGGITQHIGAYTVEIRGQKITFLDTPGHEAFTAMRARGAQATDIAILVVAADDGVMPQTIEAINHAKAAGVQTIVAINKMDKVGANPERIKQQLTEYGLLAEEWGGDTIMVPVSAITGEGVDQLLEMILLVAEVQDYRANPNRKARGIIVEARLDKGRGPVATVLVKTGTLRVGDTIVAGTAYGRVRAMVNDRGERVKEALPSDPVEVIGFNDVPEAGDIITAVDDDSLSRRVAEERKDKLRAALIKNQQKASLDDLFSQISAGQIKDLNLIIKADVQGSVEAVKQSLEKLSNDEVRVRCIHGGVGAITETDIMLASASNAIIIGFNVRPDNNVREIAEREKIDIRLYRVIYSAIEDVEKAMKGMLAPKFREVVLGSAQVRQVFKITGAGTVAGCYVTDGKVVRNAQARLLRDSVVIHEGKIDSLKRFKDDAREVAAGYECGMGFESYNDIKEGDVIECFQMEEIEQ
ncbi:MAG TPA: translation initiation factor IF-2 [Candidatus Pullichristensenella avicola]|nr:translation initiation factor IF-2 [Candidatus Pullichristensenella avicola]